MRSRMWIVLVLASMVLMTLWVPATAEQSIDRTTKQHRLVERSFHPLSGDGGINPGPPAVQVTDDDRLFIYVGSWGGFCAQAATAGVEVIDLTDPDKPEQVGVIHPSAGLPKDVRIFSGKTAGGERRDLLVFSRERCFERQVAEQLLFPEREQVPYPWTGFEVYDVTDPESPKRLGEWVSGGQGTHNLSVFERPDLGGRVFVAATFLETGLSDPVKGPRSDGWVKIVEITDPTTPALVATWGVSDHQDETECIRRGLPSSCFIHDVQVSADGMTAYLAYWAAGVVLLDLADIAKPALIGQWFPPPDPVDACGETEETVHTTKDGNTITTDDDGSTHTVAPISVGGRDLLLVTDEERSAPVQGFLRIVDVTDPPSRTVQPPEWEQVATYLPPHACSQDDAFYAHQAWPGPTMPGGGDIYLSAFADGLRVLSLDARGTKIREMAWYVPGDDDHDNDRDGDLVLNAMGFTTGFEGSITIHHPRTGELLILVSDFLRGLYVLEPSAP